MIPVKPADDSVGYATAEEAIAAACRDPLQPKARRDAASFAGRRFVTLWSDGRQWVLEFSGGLWLRVFAEGRQVAWSVEAAPPDVAKLAEPVELEWPSGARSRADSAALTAVRRGAAFWQFWVNDMGFHVYLRGQLILCFSSVRRRDTGEPLVHLWEDD